TRHGCKRDELGGSANLRCRKVSSHGLADPARLQGESEVAPRTCDAANKTRTGGKTLQGCKRHEGGGSANVRCRKVNSHGLADSARLQEARARWLGELAVQESTLVEVSRPGKVARGMSEVARRTCGAGKYARRGCKRHERGGSANFRCKKVNSHGLVDPARLQEARARWLGELSVQESKLARVSRPGKVARGTSEVARRTFGARKRRKVSSHGLADPARSKEARAMWLDELAVEESKLARISRPGKVARGTSKVARRTCGAKKKVSSHGLADPARLQGENEVAPRTCDAAKKTRTGEKTLQGCKRHEGGGSANLRCRKVNSHGLAVPASLQEARARWLGELAVQKSKLARVSRPGKVARGTSEVARRTCGAKK
ncbi:hypothetical protein CRG98_047235, partial [Punica granatum]